MDYSIFVNSFGEEFDFFYNAAMQEMEAGNGLYPDHWAALRWSLNTARRRAWWN